ncbi:MAG: hypothetical protein LBD12_06620 [Clostridiales Family XIII bacterium]|jgi:hypothetical protein|nr:hypothetical protein [Clostridiales Family XIII bacterium]
MLRKLIAVALVVAMVCGLASSAFAAPPTGIEKSRAELGVDPGVLYLLPTDIKGLKLSLDGQYAMEMDTPEGKRLFPVERVDGAVKDASSMQSLLDDASLPTEVREKVQSRYEQALQIGNMDAKVSVLLPTQERRSVTNGMSMRATQTSTPYTYNGVKMKSVRTYWTGIGTPTFQVKKGAGTWATANLIYNVLLTGASVASPAVSFYASGISLWQAFKNHYNVTTVTGSTRDLLEVYLLFDCIDQHTYAQYGSSWNLGLYSQKITIIYEWQRQYYYNDNSGKGKDFQDDRWVSVPHQSKHYDSPWATAYQYQFSTVPYEEKLSWKVHEKIFSF